MENPLRAMRTGLAAAALAAALFIAPASWAAGEAAGGLMSMAAGAEPAALLGQPRRISLAVQYDRKEGMSWIVLRGDYHSVLHAPFAAVREVILAYEDYPRRFSNISSVAADRSGPGPMRIRQRSVVRVLGIEFPSEYTLEIREESGAGRAVLTWRSIADDGSVRDISGGWYIEPVRVGSEDCTYVRYSVSSSVRARYPLQREIMSAFADRGFFSVLHQLEQAVAAR